ncbi:MAG: PcfJ domain-containing protein [Alphaproteobacteria bacterium]|nr:PcfJ domain-containing protein [Alphaproteobacteria bacterium]
MGLRRATDEMMRWRRRVDLACLLGDGIENTWLESGRFCGYDFTPLMTLEDFITESRLMNNCLDQYGDRLATGLIRIFSIRHEGKRIANVEVGPIPAQGALPSIVQIKGPQNRQVPLTVWQAAHLWLEGQALEDMPRRPGPVRNETDERDAPWQPYLDWLPAARRHEFEKYVLDVGRRPPRLHLLHPVVEALAAGRRTMQACN